MLENATGKNSAYEGSGQKCVRNFTIEVSISVVISLIIASVLIVMKRLLKPYCIDFSLRLIINSAKKDTANAIIETVVPMFPLGAKSQSLKKNAGTIKTSTV
ncbi:hypothetical protein Q8W41_24610, partial [Vibrio splendidus]|nr:hypothetical protein [Vibrio splendidus]